MTFGDQSSWNDVQISVYHNVMQRLHDQQVVVDEELEEWVTAVIEHPETPSTPLQWLHILSFEALAFTSSDTSLQLEGTLMEGTTFDLDVCLRSEEGSWTLTLDDHYLPVSIRRTVSTGDEHIVDQLEAVILLFAEVLSRKGVMWHQMLMFMTAPCYEGDY